MGVAQNTPSNPKEELANESPLRNSPHFHVKARLHENKLIIVYWNAKSRSLPWQWLIEEEEEVIPSITVIWFLSLRYDLSHSCETPLIN